MMNSSTQIRENISRLKSNLEDICLRFGRKASDVSLIAVTKTIPAEQVLNAYNAGILDFGENRVQELIEKKKKLPGDIRWHMIGHLQTNKVKLVVGETALIHSLDSFELADAVIKVATQKKIKEVPCLIQVNSSGEQTKFGFSPEEVVSFVRSLKINTPLKIRGLMTIGPLTEDLEKVRESFRSMSVMQKKLSQLFPEHDWSILSMGMSGDFAVALEEGSTCLRIGSAIFGSRA